MFIGVDKLKIINDTYMGSAACKPLPTCRLT